MMSQLTKVLFQIKDGKLAPSIDCDPVNPLIRFDKTPFTLVKELRDWDRRNDDQPFRALINAFGATGSVGNLVIEEYIDKRQFKKPAVHPNLILLSAETQEQVIQQAKRLLDYLNGPDRTNPDISQIAFTLRVGREALAERLAIVCAGPDDLKVKLKGCITGYIDGCGVIFGTADMKLKHRELNDSEYVMTVAGQWTKGVAIRWSDAFETGIKRIPLPNYPFLKERHWVKEPVQDRTKPAISAGRNPRMEQSVQKEPAPDDSAAGSF